MVTPHSNNSMNYTCRLYILVNIPHHYYQLPPSSSIIVTVALSGQSTVVSVDMVENDIARENDSVFSRILSSRISMTTLWLVPGTLPSVNSSDVCVRIKSALSEEENVQEVL